MYEDRTQDVIVAEMLEDFGTNVRTDEGSLAYNACVKTAAELEDAYTESSIFASYEHRRSLDLSGLHLHDNRRGRGRGKHLPDAV